MNFKKRNTLEYRTGVDFKLLNKLTILIKEAKELQLNDLEVSMLKHFLKSFAEYIDYYQQEFNSKGLTVSLNKIKRSLGVLKSYLYFRQENNIFTFLILYSGYPSNKAVVKLIPDLHKALKGFFDYESSNLKKFSFSKCTPPYLHILKLKDRSFEEYMIRNIKASITFPFASKGYHKHCSKIYSYTMKWVVEPSKEILIHMGHEGNYYDIDIDKLLCSGGSELLDYPTCEFFYKGQKIDSGDDSWICKIQNEEVILKCKDNTVPISFKDLNEIFLNSPPCSLQYLTIEIYGDLEYYIID